MHPTTFSNILPTFLPAAFSLTNNSLQHHPSKILLSIIARTKAKDLPSNAEKQLNTSYIDKLILKSTTQNIKNITKYSKLRNIDIRSKNFDFYYIQTKSLQQFNSEKH